MTDIKEEKKAEYTLYTANKCPYSAKVLVVFAECGLLAQTNLVTLGSALEKEELEKTLSHSPLTIPCLLLEPRSVVCGSDSIIQAVLADLGKTEQDLVAYTAFQDAVYKDYSTMQKQLCKLTGPLAWFNMLDANSDGVVTLDEMLDGLDLTRLVAANRRGYIIQDSKWTDTVDQVDYLNTEEPDFVEGYRLKMTLATFCDDYDMFFEATGRLLELAPYDLQVLLMRAGYAHGLGKTNIYDECVKRLQSPEGNAQVAEDLKRMVDLIDRYWSVPIPKQAPAELTGKASILALGSPADDDGTPRPRLLATLTKTLEVAKLYPDADIYVTGGAVSSKCAEAVAMQRWLVANGVEEKRITMETEARDTVGNYVNIAPMLTEKKVKKVVLVTVYYHLCRSSILANAIFKREGVDVEIVPVAGESDLEGEGVLEKRLVVERVASYRDTSRALNLYELKDYAKYKK